MRIMCPNCAAQYEVDDALIPETGRDVQCSNCGKGWFQPKHEATAEEPKPETVAVAPEVEKAEPEPASAEPEDEPAPVSELEAEPATEPAAETEPAEEPVTARDRIGVPASEPDQPAARAEGNDDDEPVTPAAPPAVAPRRPDESVLSVLREEAEREIAQRRHEAGPIESQPDLGLSEPAQRRTSPSETEIAAGAAVAASARRDLLPDIDEINSTLRPERAARMGEDGETLVEGRRRGFRLGFGLMLILAGLLIGLYMAAGPLATAVPALEPVLVAYVEAANGFRAWIDGLLARGIEAMSG